MMIQPDMVQQRDSEKAKTLPHRFPRTDPAPTRTLAGLLLTALVLLCATSSDAFCPPLRAPLPAACFGGMRGTSALGRRGVLDNPGGLNPSLLAASRLRARTRVGTTVSLKEGADGDAVPPLGAAGGFGDGFVPSDFMKLHEAIVGATVGGADDEGDGGLIDVGAALADEMQRAYTLSVCAFNGTADYARRLSTLDESAALKWVRTQTVKLSEEEAVMQIYPEQGKWLAQLVVAMGAKRVLEIGTFTGYSSTSMASFLPPGGKLVCLEVDEGYAAIAR